MWAYIYIRLIVGTCFFSLTIKAGQNDQALRRSVSDVSVEMDRISKDFNCMVQINEVERSVCECCGMSEDYTPAYVSSIKDFYCGKWVCGLCSEAVKEHQNRTPKVTMNEALDSHMAFCKKYNRTTRLNPKLSLAEEMRDIAKRSSQHKNFKNFPLTKIARSTSCNPRIEFQIPPERE